MLPKTMRLFVLWGVSLCLGFVFAPRFATAAQREIVSFRLTKWTTVHLDDAKKAKSFATTLTKIGCETKQQEHSGHYDISYRCPEWKSITAKTHEEAHQWERWLKSNGFESEHKH